MPRTRSMLAPLALAGLLALAGCTHNHYYYGPGGMAAAPTGTVVGSQPVVVGSNTRKQKAVVAGSYCDVPAVTSGAPVIVSSAPRGGSSTVVTSTPAPSRTVVASDPVVTGSQDGWRRRSAENMATTRVSGALDDEVTR